MAVYSERLMREAAAEALTHDAECRGDDGWSEEDQRELEAMYAEVGGEA